MLKSKRRALAIGLTAILALAGSLMIASGVIGKSKRTVVHDRRGDGGAFEPHTRPAACDILKATSKLVAKRGRLRHAVTTRGKQTLSLTAPPVVITRHRVRGSIGLAALVLSPGEAGVRAHLRNHRKTVVYQVKRRVVADAVQRRDKYFWVVDQCTIHRDKAPNHGSAVQSLRRHGHRHHR